MSKDFKIKTNFLSLRVGSENAGTFQYAFPKNLFLEYNQKKVKNWSTTFIKGQEYGLRELCKNFLYVPEIDSNIPDNKKIFFKTVFVGDILITKETKNATSGYLEILIAFFLYEFIETENKPVICLQSEFTNEENPQILKTYYTDSGRSIKFPIEIPMVAFDSTLKQNQDIIPKKIISKFNAYIYTV